MLLEVIASSVEDAVAAERGGAHRIELVRALDRDGLTPPLELVSRVLDAVRIPVRVMLRESDGFRVTGPAELEVLERQARALAALPIDGLVLGWIDEAGEADLSLTGGILQLASPLRATFHRAFDATPDPLRTLERLKRCEPIDRVLTSGGTGSLEERTRRLEEYQRHAKPAITVLAGGGIDASSYRQLRASTTLREAHAGRAARLPPTADGRVTVSRVAAFFDE
jgi:copper homeostasis protein